FILKHIASKLDAILESGSWRDAKSALQEVAQRMDNHTPIYKVLSEEGPDHDKVFTLGVYVGSKLKGKGTGSSKQSAQQKAAEAAVEKYETSQKS
ncbi:MAG: putative dsRNA-binding protein, partial [Patescibacteria group bacterium]